MSKHTPGTVGPSRRDFLLTGVAGIGAWLLPGATLAKAASLQLLSPASRGDKYFAANLRTNQIGVNAEPIAGALPMRGHGLVIDPRHPQQALIMARRPGATAVKIDITNGEILQQWEAQPDRHFFGHACYSADGRTLFVVENDIEVGEGVISVRDADDFSVRAEYRTHGIGPHDILLLADGVTLAVANGGIQTFPETGRVKLNRGRIESGLAYLDSRDGKLLGNYPLSLPQTSLRHLALAPNGRLAAALQYEGNRKGPGVPLMAFHAGEPSLQVATAVQAEWDRMRHYAASVAYDPASDRFALSCPHGDTLACWQSDGSYAGRVDVPKVSGIAFGGGQGFASNELGDVFRLDLARLTARLQYSLPDLEWDNHLTLRS